MIPDEHMNFDSRGWLKCGCVSRTLGVFGSRSLRDERVEITILEKMRSGGFHRIVTCQEPQGVSEVAQRVAKKYGYPLELHFLNMQYLRGAFEQRSREIVAVCDEFLVIHDGASKGTANELKLVEKSGKPCQYEIMENTPFERSVGFNIMDDWDKKGGAGDFDFRELTE